MRQRLDDQLVAVVIAVGGHLKSHANDIEVLGNRLDAQQQAIAEMRTQNTTALAKIIPTLASANELIVKHVLRT